MVNVKSFALAIKITWLRRLFLNKKWKNIIIAELNTDLKQITSFGSDYLKMLINKTKNQFWKDVFNSIIILNQQLHAQNLVMFSKYPLWYSNIITIENQSVAFRNWIQKNIYYVKDLIKIAGNVPVVMTYNEICELYNFRPNFLEFLGIKRNIEKLKIHSN